MKPALELHNVYFKFTETHDFFFSNLSLSFTTNAIHYIQGDNGSGKSTLMHLLVGHTMPGIVNGTITRNGKMHLVAQRTDEMIAPTFTVAQNLALAQLARFPGLCLLPPGTTPLFLKHIKPQAIAGSLSGGQKQILALAMALQQPVTLLLLDEPTAALDHENACMVFEVLHEITRTISLTVIIICHHKEHIRACGASTVVRINASAHHLTRTVTQKAL